MKTTLLFGEKTQNSAKVFTNVIDEATENQVREIVDMAIYRDSKIRIMPDCHAGKGAVIGTTMTITDKITPNLVGVDIGCGVLVVKLKNKDVDLEKFDLTIKERIPHGSNNHLKIKSLTARMFELARGNGYFKNDFVYNNFNIEHILKAMGTLGGGNHFIELAKDSNDSIYLLIHTGSRSIGAQVAKHYQKLAIQNMKKFNAQEIVDKLKSEGRHKEIHTELTKAKEKFKLQTFNKDLAYLEGEQMNDYINDLKLAQQFAVLNRLAIASVIMARCNLKSEDSFDTPHNYLDTDRMILRKGAQGAEAGQQVIIPINMRDGSILAVGKGNKDWNYSAPHGAGRILSRTKAKQQLNLDDFKNTMQGIYTTTVGEDTLDEAPDAYKNINDIIDNIGDTVEIKEILKPIYNFKAAE